MERKLIILKTFSDTKVADDFTEEISTQIAAIAKQCCRGKSKCVTVFALSYKFPHSEC